jgi:hypothetical protein
MPGGYPRHGTNICFESRFAPGFKMVRRARIWQTSPVTELNAPQQIQPGSPPADAAPEPPPPATVPEARPLEIGGRDGPDPTRYGDWEKGGRCIDF